MTCPACGGVLQIIEACEMSETYAPAFFIIPAGGDVPELPRRLKIRPAALCTECEFAIEIRTGGAR